MNVSIHFFFNTSLQQFQAVAKEHSFKFTEHFISTCVCCRLQRRVGGGQGKGVVLEEFCIVQSQEGNRYEHADRSSVCLQKAAISSPVLGLSQGPCVAESEPALLAGSRQFGLSKNSHIALAFDDTKVKNRYVLFWSMTREPIIKALNIHI